LFGGKPSVVAPKAYQVFEILTIGPGGILKTPEDAFDFMVKQQYLPSNQIEASPKEKRDYVRKVLLKYGGVPADFLLITEEDNKKFESLSKRQQLGPEAEPLARRPYE